LLKSGVSFGSARTTCTEKGETSCDQFRSGQKGSFEAVVRREELANTFKDASFPPVLSTPVMIKFMGNAALRAIQPYLDSNETAVGTEVSVRHLAATPIGRKVRAEAEVTAVDGTRISFSVRATDFEHEIGEGLHERRVVDRARLTRHIAEMIASDSASRDVR
jgi:fluoroacetyl-CoA thioesterase